MWQPESSEDIALWLADEFTQVSFLASNPSYFFWVVGMKSGNMLSGISVLIVVDLETREHYTHYRSS
jgi:hypothetical protein